MASAGGLEAGLNTAVNAVPQRQALKVGLSTKEAQKNGFNGDSVGVFGDLMVIWWWFDGIEWWFYGDLMGLNGEFMVM